MTSGVRARRSLESDTEHVWTLQQDEDDADDDDWEDWDDDDEDFDEEWEDEDEEDEEWEDEEVDEDLDVGGPRRPSEDDWN